MKLFESIFARAGKAVAKIGGSRLREDVPISGLEEKDDWKYRPLTARKTRDLTPLTQRRMQDIAFWLFDTNPLAHRIITMGKDFVLGEGLTYVAKDPDVKKVLDDFWNDPVNQWDIRQHERVLELGIYGEQFLPAFVNKVNGHVRLGYIDPTMVTQVICDPENVQKIIAIQVSPQLAGQAIPVTEKQKEEYAKSREEAEKKGYSGDPNTYNVINWDDDPKSPTYGKMVGESFYFGINKVSNALRGRSDLFSLADWIDGYEQFLYNRIERSHLMNVFLWDVTFTGWAQDKVDEWVKRFGLPKPGSIRAHNEKVKWEAITPKLEANDASQEAKMLRGHILAGAGFPPHWFAGGEGITRATALEMGTPSFKMLKSRQKYVKHMISTIFKFVIDQAIIHKELKNKKEEDLKFKIIFPKIVEKEFASFAGAILQMTNSLMSAVDLDFISADSARKVYMWLVSQLGFEMEPEKERESISADKKEKLRFYLDQQKEMLKDIEKEKEEEE